VLDRTAGQVASLPFVELKGIEVVYSNKTVALKPTDIEFADNEVTVLLGPSGAGKSTLLRVLNRLVVPTRGTVSVRDLGVLETHKLVRAHRLRTGMVFQQHQLISRLTALQNVLLSRIGNYSFMRSLLPLPDNERCWALECLDRVGLFEKSLERCDALSGGQQQRVGIARAIAQRPDLILADEPVASLDPASSERVLSLLRDICKQDGIPAIVSLHQLEYAREFADRIVGLSHGSVVFDGRPDELTDEVLEKIYGS
jgi:phosphonate transport system ATP-binding protein